MKVGFITLVASVGKLEEMKMETTIKATPTMEGCEGKVGGSKGKGKVVVVADDDDIDEHLAFLSRRFSKLKFKRNPSTNKPFKKD